MDDDTPTAGLVRRLRTLGESPLPQAAATVAKQCLLDWLGVALAGRSEPLVDKLAAALGTARGDDGEATVLGLDRRARADDAALINGAMGHALDFDDVLAVMGHPTAPVAPALFALAEATGASGEDVLAAFVVGVEAESRIGVLMGPSHYAHGWHGTATFGTFGAAAAAGWLLELDDMRMRHALGLAGAQAAGLKSMFGTMTKPLHAGRAAQTGVLAARLAARGFTSDIDVLGSAQGFAATQSTSVDVMAGLAERHLPHIVDTLFKYHAACYLTHNAIEAADRLRRDLAIDPGAIERVTIGVQPLHLGVCNIEAPRTGLECKFSLRMTVAMALHGEDTFDEALFSDATAARPDLADLCRRMVVEPSAATPATTVALHLRDGSRHAVTADTSIPERDLAAQQARIERKFARITASALSPDDTAHVTALCRHLERLPNLDALMRACSGARRPLLET